MARRKNTEKIVEAAPEAPGESPVVVSGGPVAGLVGAGEVGVFIKVRFSQEVFLNGVAYKPNTVYRFKADDLSGSIANVATEVY